jgi:site-specific DNA recombinase
MKTADLYIRVSTDEQADKGYSQRHQEEVLRKYCTAHGIEVREVYLEDHSAKTFNRPQWKRLLADLKKRRKAPDLVLFTKWDRFSRNAGDAYQMLAVLYNLGVEPQAIEQPIDLSVPENKIMLAVYLATPEVENDRRALNVRSGMRRALKEGRWMGPAPYGYSNMITETGRKYISPVEPQASLIRWVFEEVAYGTGTANSVLLAARQRGFGCGRSHFFRLLRNPVYAGLIFVPRHREEAARSAPGQHTAIIPLSLFEQVQVVLNGRRKIPQTRQPADLFPLRGFLICPVCGQRLTASGSQGRRLRYYYYHCISPCPLRVSAPVTNARFTQLLCTLQLRPPLLTVLEQLVHGQLQQGVVEAEQQRQQRLAERDRQQHRLLRARDLLLSGDLDPSDYRAIKDEAEKVLSTWRKAEENPTVGPVRPADLQPDWRSVYAASDRAGKRAFFAALFPDPWIAGADLAYPTQLSVGFQLAYSQSR